MQNVGRALAVLSLLSVAGCSITTHVDPVPPSTIPSLCIADNPKVWSKQFLPILREQLAARGIATTVYDGGALGRGDDKLAKLLDQLLREVNHGAAPVPVEAASTMTR
jgi:hypothetical protein